MSIRPGCGLGFQPPIGTRVIDSTPPATITSAIPAMIRSALCAMVCKPLEQNRLTVMAATLLGSPARNCT